MATLVTDRWLEERLRLEREESGANRYDEVWEGLYLMPPMPDDEHQEIASRLGAVLQQVVGWDGPDKVYVGVNVSDRREEWKRNYRVPDIAVFLSGTSATDCGTHWCGGPDFVAEIVSPDDRTRDKLPFYAQIGVRNLLLVERQPWALELHELRDGQLALAGESTLEAPAVLSSTVLPVTFRLVAGTDRPSIEVAHSDGSQRWSV